jgi:hypothetical protein
VTVAYAARANAAVQRAIQKGILERRAACENCGAADNIQAHHENYDKPLEVEWLCVPCHKKRHAGGNSLIDSTNLPRPQKIIYLRDEEQREQLRAAAKAQGIPVNE